MSVLVAAKDDAAIEAVSTLLGRQPGITPVVFGSSEQRERLALRLANGELVPCNDDVLDRARAAFERATHERDLAWGEARRSLFDEWRRTPEGSDEIARIRRLAPSAPTGADATIDASCRVRPTSARDGSPVAPVAERNGDSAPPSVPTSKHRCQRWWTPSTSRAES